jgi:hypothetical protein
MNQKNDAMKINLCVAVIPPGVDSDPNTRGSGQDGGGPGGRGNGAPGAGSNRAQPGVTNTGGGGGGGGNMTATPPADRTGGNGAPGVVALVYPPAVSFSDTGLTSSTPAPAPNSRTITIFTAGDATITFS